MSASTTNIANSLKPPVLSREPPNAVEFLDKAPGYLASLLECPALARYLRSGTTPIYVRRDYVWGLDMNRRVWDVDNEEGDQMDEGPAEIAEAGRRHPVPSSKTAKHSYAIWEANFKEWRDHANKFNRMKALLVGKIDELISEASRNYMSTAFAIEFNEIHAEGKPYTYLQLIRRTHLAGGHAITTTQKRLAYQELYNLVQDSKRMSSLVAYATAFEAAWKKCKQMECEEAKDVHSIVHLFISNLRDPDLAELKREWLRDENDTSVFPQSFEVAKAKLSDEKVRVTAERRDTKRASTGNAQTTAGSGSVVQVTIAAPQQKRARGDDSSGGNNKRFKADKSASQGRANEDSEDSSGAVKCIICGKTNHTAQECFKLKKMIQDGTVPAPQSGGATRNNAQGKKGNKDGKKRGNKGRRQKKGQAAATDSTATVQMTLMEHAYTLLIVATASTEQQTSPEHLDQGGQHPVTAPAAPIFDTGANVHVYNRGDIVEELDSGSQSSESIKVRGVNGETTELGQKGKTVLGTGYVCEECPYTVLSPVVLRKLYRIEYNFDRDYYALHRKTGRREEACRFVLDPKTRLYHLTETKGMDEDIRTLLRRCMSALKHAKKSDTASAQALTVKGSKRQSSPSLIDKIAKLRARMKKSAMEASRTTAPASTVTRERDNRSNTLAQAASPARDQGVQQAPPDNAGVQPERQTTIFFTREQQERAAGVMSVHNALNHPGDKVLKTMFDNRALIDCPFVGQDVDVKNQLYGPCLACGQGKAIIERLPKKSLSPPAPYVGHTLFGDIMYVYARPFLRVTESLTKFGIVVALQSKHGKLSLLPALTTLRNFFDTQVHLKTGKEQVVRVLRTDNEEVFSSIRGDLLSIHVTLEQSPSGDHCGTIEREIASDRTLIRSTIHALPYKCPPRLYPYLVKDVVQARNLFPNKSTGKRTPFEIVMGKTVSFHDIGPAFGTVGLFPVPKGDQGNKQAARAEMGMVLTRDFAKKGSVEVFVLDKNEVVNRSFRHMKQMPIAIDVVNKLNAIAEKDVDKFSHNVIDYEPLDKLNRDSVDDDGHPVTRTPMPQQPQLPVTQAPAEVPEVPPDTSNTATPPSDEEEQQEREDSVATPPPGAEDSAETFEDEEDVSDHGGGEDMTNVKTSEQALTSGRSTPTPADTPRSEVLDDTRSELSPASTTTGMTRPHTSDSGVVPASVGESANQTSANSMHEPPPSSTEERQRESGSMKLRPRPKPSTKFAALLSTVLVALAAGAQQPVAKTMTVQRALQTHGEAAQKAIRDEISQLVQRHVWKPIKHKGKATKSRHTRILPCMMFLKEKFFADGQFEKLKARLAAGGHQVDKSKYRAEDTSSPTVLVETLMLALGIAAHERRDIETIDFPGAYLFAELHETQLMRLDKVLAGFVVQLFPEYREYLQEDGTMLVELMRALYGLPEASKLWYEHLKKTLLSAGYKCSHDDPCLFHRTVGKDKSTICVHVDDIIHSYTSERMVDDLHRALKKEYKEFKVHKLEKGKNVSYLGIDIRRNQVSGELMLSMPGYTQEIIEETGTTGTAKTPALADLFDINPESKPIDVTAFVSKLMKVMYLAKRVRYDILLPCTFLATRAKAPTEQDDRKLDRVLRYLNATRDLFLTIKPESLRLYAYVDSSYAVHGDAKGQSGRIIGLGRIGGVSFVKSIKQKLVARSSTESELIGLADAVGDILWHRNVLKFLGVDLSGTTVFQDNMSTITMAESGRGGKTGNSKHIDVRYFFVKQHIDSGEIKLAHLRTDHMIADVLTKPLQGKLFYALRHALLNLPEPGELRDTLKGLREDRD